MVETALTMPMMIFTLLAIVQMTAAHHARILAEYAAFKAVRSGSVYRAECDCMLKAGLVALVPSIMEPADTRRPGERPTLRTGANYRTMFENTASYAERNQTAKGTPILWLGYKLENDSGLKDFDEQLESGKTPWILRVKLTYFYQLRIPFANYVMTRFWIASQTGGSWGNSANTDVINFAKKPGRLTGTNSSELIDEVEQALKVREYVMPIVSSWSMRMMSNPMPGAAPQGEGDCKQTAAQGGKLCGE